MSRIENREGTFDYLIAVRTSEVIDRYVIMGLGAGLKNCAIEENMQFKDVLRDKGVEIAILRYSTVAIEISFRSAPYSFTNL